MELGYVIVLVVLDHPFPAFSGSPCACVCVFGHYGSFVVVDVRFAAGPDFVCFNVVYFVAVFDGSQWVTL